MTQNHKLFVCGHEPKHEGSFEDKKTFVELFYRMNQRLEIHHKHIAVSYYFLEKFVNSYVDKY
jgi:hypothetical protein